jgi:hypothetical protein
METAASYATARVPWNKDKLTGQKSPLKLKEIWAIQIRLQWERGPGIWRCSIRRSTASCERAT